MISVVWGIILLLVLFMLPGCMLIMGGKSFTWLESIVLSLLAGFAFSSLIGLLLLDLGIFSARRLVLAAVVCAIAVGIYRRRTVFPDLREVRSPRLRPFPAVILFLVLAMASYFYFRPADTSILSSDATIYFTSGVNIARSGTIAFREDLIRELPDSLKDKLFRFQGEASEYHRLPGGFILRNPDEGTTVVSFQPLFPLWIAVFVSFFGMKGGFYLSPLLGILSCLVFYLLAVKILREKPYVLFALAVLAFSPAQIWYARYTMPEIMLQFLILGGLYTRFLYEEEHTFCGSLSAVLFGIALAAKFHAFIIVFFIIIYCLVSILQGKENKNEPYFFLPLIALVFLNILHLYIYPNDYPSHLIIFFWQMLSARGLISIYISLAILILLLAALIIWRSHLSSLLREIGPYVPVALAVLAVYGLWIGPYAWNPLRLIPGFEPSYNSGNLVRLSWYLTPAGVVMAVLGCLLMLRKEEGKTEGQNFFLWLAVSYALFFLYKGDAISQHYWNARKYVPFILPAAACFMAIALSWLRSCLGNRFYAGKLIFFFGVCLVGTLLYYDRTLIHHREGRGALEQLKSLADGFGDRPLILVQKKVEGWLLAQALNYLFEKPALSLPGRVFTELDAEVLQNLARETGRTLYYLAPDSSALFETFPRATNTFIPEGEIKLLVPVMERVESHLPERTVVPALTLSRYKIEPVARMAKEVFIDLGKNDHAYISEGFHAAEKVEKRLIRWTNGQGTLYIPRLPPGRYTMSLSLSGAALPSGERDVKIYYENHFLRRFLLNNHFTTFNIPFKILEEDEYRYMNGMELLSPCSVRSEWETYSLEGVRIEVTDQPHYEGFGSLRVTCDVPLQKIIVHGKCIPIKGAGHLAASIRIKQKHIHLAKLKIAILDSDGKSLGLLSSENPAEKKPMGRWLLSECSGDIPEQAAFLRPQLWIIGMRGVSSEVFFDQLILESDTPFGLLRNIRLDLVSSSRVPGNGDERNLGIGMDWLKIMKSKSLSSAIQFKQHQGD